jgi:hypothetical protein
MIKKSLCSIAIGGLFSFASPSLAWTIHENHDRFTNRYDCGVYGSYSTPFVINNDEGLVAFITLPEGMERKIHDASSDYIQRCHTDNILNDTNWSCQRHAGARIRVEYFLGAEPDVQEASGFGLLDEILKGDRALVGIPIDNDRINNIGAAVVEYRVLYDHPRTALSTERVRTEIKRGVAVIEDLKAAKELLLECEKLQTQKKKAN